MTEDSVSGSKAQPASNKSEFKDPVSNSEARPGAGKDTGENDENDRV